MNENNKRIDDEVKELSDEQIKDVAAGDNLSLHFFTTEAEVRFIFFPGDIVYVKESIFSKTIRCEVVRSEIFSDPQYNCFEDLYIVRGPDGLLRKVLRDDIVNQAD